MLKRIGDEMNSKLMFFVMCTTVTACYAMEQNRELKVGIYSEINKRERQEDRFYTGKVDGGMLYAVYDGHGGATIAITLAREFPGYFSQTFGEMKHRMETAFVSMDNDQWIKNNGHCGSTASMVFIKDGIAHFAHVGDSRAVLEQQNKFFFATQDHKPESPDEKERILKAGGLILKQKLFGTIAVSRAFGDYQLDGEKKFLIAKPDYTQISLTENNRFLVLATDGLWDAMSSEEVVEQLVNNSCKLKDMNEFAKLLGLFAISRGSVDNITVMVVDLLS